MSPCASLSRPVNKSVENPIFYYEQCIFKFNFISDKILRIQTPFPTALNRFRGLNKASEPMKNQLRWGMNPSNTALLDASHHCSWKVHQNKNVNQKILALTTLLIYDRMTFKNLVMLLAIVYSY